MSQSENQSQRLIRPCKCSGSVSFVHVQCLNQWRATSPNHSVQCSICQYKYQFQRTILASFLLSEQGMISLTIVMMIALFIVVGLSCVFVKDFVFKSKYDPISFFYQVIRYEPLHHHCRRKLPDTHYMTLLHSHYSRIYQNASVQDKFRRIWSDYYEDVQFQLYLMCSRSMLPLISLIDVFEYGVLLVSLLSFAFLLISELKNGAIVQYIPAVVGSAAGFGMRRFALGCRMNY